ncbi:bifunctional adenosylcobinamide kinase/adenosylcobinamide-phosphate guanylyltransferase [Sulfitobacter sp. TSTF-M16]|uniref:Bifunctional adenosylcobalamin biosynthesis protein n=1 Tax=Sulfitobacter aestuariivivens TaxID=2766981 RepID=A0A927D9U4_9RHOB|nr:bifunctional adenosylcobinamide kinase/adenosylcobinamide-phosphate guanylyltransferase [Sulfitobacter aestuariivivens]MBD3665832.1 bifunctional adenosylcobinamide kinase/adenosylcobinamide-phosphate guanylyltransferase [Sulfitobacter aestuariivivens]
MLPSGTFVLGGAASGKSAWAESFCESSDLTLNYLATGQARDAEMDQRIKIHKDRRNDRWQTIEAPFDLAPALAALDGDSIVLIDCATMWLSNHMLAETDLAAAQDDLLLALQSCAAKWVMVSNEVGHGVVPDNALARQFRDAQGRLNIALAAHADLAVLVTAGLPLTLKGTLP